MTEDIVQFRWHASEGHEIVQAVKAGASSQRKQKFLVHTAPLGSHFSITNYMPLLTEPSLFRKFAQTEPSAGDILDFVTQYGILGVGEDVILDGDPDFVYHTGESLLRWRSEIRLMQHWVDVWTAVEAENRRFLRRSVKWQGREHVSYKPKDSYAGTSLIVIASKRVRPDLLKRIPPNDVLLPAKVAVQLAINKWLDGRVSPRVLWDEKGRLRLFHEPDTLLGAMWLQFALTVTGNIHQRRCVACGTWFEVIRGVNRKDKQYCSDACRAAAYRARRSKK